MTLTETHLRKLGDETTRATLAVAAGNTRLRAILTVARPVVESDYGRRGGAKETRREMRARLIRNRQEATARSLQPIIARLARYGLDIKGGTSPRVSRLLIVDGAAEAILNCAELAEVESIYIDRKFITMPVVSHLTQPGCEHTTAEREQPRDGSGLERLHEPAV